MVGVATSHISSRGSNIDEGNSPTTSENTSKVTESVNLMLGKISVLTDLLTSRQSSVNVYNNNNCGILKRVTQDQASQTCQEPSLQISPEPAQKATPETTTEHNNPTDDPLENVRKPDEKSTENVELILQCTMCNKVLPSQSHLEKHIESAHGKASQKSVTTTVPCDFCDARLQSDKKLQSHISELHATAFLQCPECMLRFKSSDKLNEHVNIFHTVAHSSSTGTPISTPSVSDSSTTFASGIAQPSELRPSAASNSKNL